MGFVSPKLDTGVLSIACIGLFAFILVIGRTDLPLGDGVDIRLALIPAVLATPLLVRRGFERALASYGLVLCLALWLTVSVFWRQDHLIADALVRKLIDVAYIAGLASCALLISDRQRAGFFWGFIVIFGGLVALIALFFLLSRGITSFSSGRLMIPGTGPITLSRACAYTLIGMLFLGNRRLLSIAGPVLMLLILATGARGSIIAGMVGFAVFALLSKITLRKLGAVIAPTLAICSAGVIFVKFSVLGAHLYELVSQRALLTIIDRYTSGRDLLYLASIENFLSRPMFGSGLDSFRFGAFTYPHNLILELLVESGLIGMLLLTFNLAVSARNGAVANNRIALVFLAFALTSAMFSGDIYDSRWVFVALILCSLGEVSEPPDGLRRRG